VTAGARTALRPRSVTLVLCRSDGGVVGALPPFEVELPWWQEVADVVDEARAVHGAEVVILRLLEAEPSPFCAGGAVTYLAEVMGDPGRAVQPWPGALDPGEDLRATWARVGGPGADLAWADTALIDRGRARTGPARQIRTWNLSSLWRLPTTGGPCWLKVVPPFFAHEGAVLAHLDAERVPPLVAADGPRILVDEVPGPDRYGASGPVLAEMVDLLVALQGRWVGRVDELVGLGAPDWRSGPLTALLAALVERRGPTLDPSIAEGLEELVTGLPERFDAVGSCGLPDTIVHGDFHRGNLRGPEGSLVLLDWGDCGAGQPMLDQAAFLEGLDPEDEHAVKQAWSAAWRRLVPGCDPDRAAALLAPVSALRQALIYDTFLAGIEPTERIYHQDDPARWLTRAAHLA
jgi:hypothetical protein